ncbi:MAG: MarR family transcriptional regulator, partial [Bacteroidetes bacterium]
MARKHQPEKLDDLYKAFEQNPGRRPGFIARLLRIPRSSVTRSLPALEDEGY